MNDLDLLKQLHTLTITALLDKIKSGEATASDLTVAVKMLKDNGINADAKVEPNLKALAVGVEAVFNGEDDVDFH